MIKQITRRKLYAEPEEGEEANAIITYVKRPWVSEQKSGLFFNTTFRNMLRIDLWIWIIYVEWESKEKRLNRYVHSLMPAGHGYTGMDFAAGPDQSVRAYMKDGSLTVDQDSIGPILANVQRELNVIRSDDSHQN